MFQFRHLRVRCAHCADAKKQKNEIRFVELFSGARAEYLIVKSNQYEGACASSIDKVVKREAIEPSELDPSKLKCKLRCASLTLSLVFLINELLSKCSNVAISANELQQLAKASENVNGFSFELIVRYVTPRQPTLTMQRAFQCWHPTCQRHCEFPLCSALGIFHRSRIRMTRALSQIGAFVQSVFKGRAEIQRVMRKKKYREMFKADLAQLQLKDSKLPGTFHIRDMIGLELLERYHA